MKKKLLAIVIAGCALVLAFGLVACGGSSSGSAASSASSASASAAASSAGSSSAASSSAASSSAAPKEFPKECVNDNGGVTLAAVMTLSGPDLVTLLEQQGYVFNEKRCYWENPTNENRFEINSVKDPKNGISLKDYEAATQPGELAKGLVSIISHDYDLSEISEEMYAGIQKSMAPELEIQETKYLAFGGECWSIATDSAGNRYLLQVGAYDEHTATVRLESDEYLAATGSGSVDEAYN